jgi:hypothetical protein
MKAYVSFLYMIPLLLTNAVLAQENTSSYVTQGGIFGSYWASLVYPGFDMGIEKPIKLDEFTWFERGQIVPRYKESYRVYSISMYHHNRFHTNLLLTAGKKNRNQRHSGYFTEWSLRGGLSRTFLAGKAYTVDNAGVISRRTLAGNFYLAGIFDYGIGYNLKYKKGIPLKPYINANAMFLAPYNRFIYYRLGVCIGAVYTPEGFMPFNKKNIRS